MHCKGSIFHHKDLVFHNGVVDNKYLILLNTPGNNEPYLFVKTTSQKKDKPLRSGCITDRSLFFIPARKTFFPLDAWVQLYEIYHFSAQTIIKDNHIKYQECLNDTIIDDIINCLFEAEDENISADVRILLKPPLFDSLLKLKSKFES